MRTHHGIRDQGIKGSRDQGDAVASLLQTVISRPVSLHGVARSIINQGCLSFVFVASSRLRVMAMLLAAPLDGQISVTS